MDEPEQSPLEPAPNRFWGKLQAAVDQFGVSPPSITNSRRHGHQPRARQHVEDYLSNAVLGVGVRELARNTGRAISTVHESIQRGKALVQSGAASRGFNDPSPPPPPQLEPDEPEDPWALE